MANSKTASGTAWSAQGTDVGLRLDKFLAAADRLGSRGRAFEAISRGKVFLNETEVTAADAARRLTTGDRVRVWMDRPGSARRRPSPRAVGGVRVVYEDGDLVVVDKPAGLLSVPLGGESEMPSVLDELHEHFRSHRRAPLVVHRIDRDTSGLVVFAKHEVAWRALKLQFLHQEPQRVYWAVVYGCPSPASGVWRDHLVWDQTELVQKETHPRDPRGKEAVSEYRVVEVFAETSLVEVRLVTGKRNQIRLQARLRGHTLVGERRYIYGPAALRPIAFARQALHALRLGVRHPTTDEPLHFESPVPEDFAELLRELRRGPVPPSRPRP